MSFLFFSQLGLQPRSKNSGNTIDLEWGELACATEREVRRTTKIDICGKTKQSTDVQYCTGSRSLPLPGTLSLSNLPVPVLSLPVLK